ncbi:MAG TPA: CHRD domain-containing protein [Gemmatimonadaceae bacterium]|nr:CHRD domain-containing protein [Gemmatimonadaceae bacterium]
MRVRHVALAGVALLLLGCVDQQLPTETEITVPLFAKGGNADFNLGTHLTGDEEVLGSDPHPSVSRAQGQAIFRVNGAETLVRFRLIAANIENVTMAHIHCGLPGVVGPPVMWLYPVIGPTGAPGPNAAGRFSGVLASGTFSPGDVTCLEADVGEDMPLLDAMRAGLTYVNVHTNDGVAPTNTGPGDFPGGEIRGQIDRGN